MTSILVVCTGNVCRSPIAEGLLRERAGGAVREARPAVALGRDRRAGKGVARCPKSVTAAAERGADIAGHVAREVTGRMVEHADLVVTMAREHRDALESVQPDTAHKTFTLKELVRILESLPAPARGRRTGHALGSRAPPPTRRAAAGSRATRTTRTSPTRWGCRSTATAPSPGSSTSGCIVSSMDSTGLRPTRCRGERGMMRIAMGCDHAGFPLEGRPEVSFLDRAGSRGPRLRHRLHRARRLPGVLRRRGARGGRRSTPIAGSCWAAPARASRSSRTRSTASARPCATTCSWRSCRGCTTMRTSWGWGRASWRPPTRARSSASGWRRRSRAGATCAGWSRSRRSNGRGAVG